MIKNLEDEFIERGDCHNNRIGELGSWVKMFGIHWEGWLKCVPAS